MANLSDYLNEFDHLADLICTDVAELPDRTSPEDQPEWMMVTADELGAIIHRRLRENPTFQMRVSEWMLECFTPEIAADLVERNDRFLEEALELVQALGHSRERAYALVDYVFDRPAGVPEQEVGGVMVTLAALCKPNAIDMQMAAEIELSRISQPEIIEKIRVKQAAKPKGSALPVAAGPARAELLEKIGQAYQVISDLAFRMPGIVRVLDYFAGETFDPDFLPWQRETDQTPFDHEDSGNG